MKKTIYHWCSYTGRVEPKYPQSKNYKGVQLFGEKGKRPNHVRCPVCRRRLVPKTIDAEPFDSKFDPIYLIPRHKIPHGKRI